MQTLVKYTLVELQLNLANEMNYISADSENIDCESTFPSNSFR